MAESVKPSIRETIEADLALAEKAKRYVEIGITTGEVDAELIVGLSTAVPDYASRLLRVLDLCEKTERDAVRLSFETPFISIAAVRRAIEGGEG